MLSFNNNYNFFECFSCLELFKLCRLNIKGFDFLSIKTLGGLIIIGKTEISTIKIMSAGERRARQYYCVVFTTIQSQFDTKLLN